MQDTSSLSAGSEASYKCIFDICVTVNAHVYKYIYIYIVCIICITILYGEEYRVENKEAVI